MTNSSPESGTTAKVATLPKCDVHSKRHDAQYDCSITLVGGRVWAFICEEVFQDPVFHATLGLGRGQRLIVEDDAPRFRRSRT